jgi:alkylation response protein AidB-like acyl-CoA dehydrogenase
MFSAPLTFGKPLVEHPVIRAKLADMIRQIDATHAQMETITYQMCTMTKAGGVQLRELPLCTCEYSVCLREITKLANKARN